MPNLLKDLYDEKFRMSYGTRCDTLSIPSDVHIYEWDNKEEEWVDIMTKNDLYAKEKHNNILKVMEDIIDNTHNKFYKKMEALGYKNDKHSYNYATVDVYIQGDYYCEMNYIVEGFNNMYISGNHQKVTIYYEYER